MLIAGMAGTALISIVGLLCFCATTTAAVAAESLWDRLGGIPEMLHSTVENSRHNLPAAAAALENTARGIYIRDSVAIT